MTPELVDGLYRAHYAAVVGHLEHLGWSLAEAEDAVQEAFLRLLREPAVEHPRSWLTLVARRWASTSSRNARRRREDCPADVIFRQYADARPSPLARVERLDDLRRAGRVLAQLRPIDREALIQWSQTGPKQWGANRRTRGRRIERARIRLKALIAA